MSHGRLKCLALKRLPYPPSPLRSVNFRRTTPGSAVALITKYKQQQTSELFDPTYPGAHLPFSKRHSLAPRWVNRHLTLYALPKAFLTKPDAPHLKPHELRPYPTPPMRPGQRSVDMSMQVIAFHSRVVARPTVRTKIKRRLKEAIRLIVTRGAAVEASRRGPKVVFRAGDVGADKWIVPDWTYVAVPTTEMLRMPFAEQVDLMRKGLGFLHERIPEVEAIFKRSNPQNATWLVRSPPESRSQDRKAKPRRAPARSAERTTPRGMGRETVSRYTTRLKLEAPVFKFGRAVFGRDERRSDYRRGDSNTDEAVIDSIQTPGSVVTSVTPSRKGLRPHQNWVCRGEVAEGV